MVTEEKLSALVSGVSTKADVIKVLGAPANLIPVKDSIVYKYETCVSSSNQTDGLISILSKSDAASNTENCQRTSIALNENTGIVTRIVFYPFANKEGGTTIRTKTGVQKGDKERKKYF